jgi:hypothetical protein
MRMLGYHGYVIRTSALEEKVDSYNRASHLNLCILFWRRCTDKASICTAAILLHSPCVEFIEAMVGTIERRRRARLANRRFTGSRGSLRSPPTNVLVGVCFTTFFPPPACELEARMLFYNGEILDRIDTFLQVERFRAHGLNVEQSRHTSSNTKETAQNLDT